MVVFVMRAYPSVEGVENGCARMDTAAISKWPFMDEMME
jgi:hypothetical protein